MTGGNLSVLSSRGITATARVLKRLRRQRFVFAMTMTIVMLATTSGPAWAQTTYPNKPLRIIVPFPPGGSNDLVARYIGQKLTIRLGQQTVIDNRAGADGIIGTQLAATAVPDGYTLLSTSITHTMTPATQRRLPYDPLKSFTAVALIGTAPVAIASYPPSQIHTLKELIAQAKTKPGQIQYASSSAVGLTHFAGELFNLMASVKMTMVPYKGGAPAITDVIAGHVPVLFNTLTPLLPHARSGRLKILGVSGGQRTAILPEAPTVTEAGVAGYEASIWWGMLGPAGMSRDIVSKLNQEIGAIVRETESVKWFTSQAADPLSATPAEFAKWMANDISKWQKVAREAGISVH
jgi:tripartite-type tricarboxylate transporter receptor subunit TctC